MIRRSACILVLAVLGAVVPSHAVPRPGLDVWELLAHSDEVWRCELMRTTAGTREMLELRQRSLELQWVTAHVRIDRRIKGAAPPGEGEFDFAVCYEEFLGYDSVMPGESVIVFLSHRDSRLAFTSPYNGKIAVPRTQAEEQLRALSPEAALTQEMARTLGSKWRSQVLAALRQLALPSNPAAIDIADVVHGLTTSEDAEVRGQAFATLLAMGQDSCVRDLIEFLMAQPTSAAMESGQHAAALALRTLSKARLESLAQTYREQVGIQFASALTALAYHKLPAVRESASLALRRMSTRALAHTLITLLDNPDRNVQYNAIIGLYEAAEGWHNALVKGYAPAAPLFFEDPDRYVNDWKRWWEEGARIEVPPGVPVIRVPVANE
jgi:hypothetical protein